jgi:hypothetical protein
MFAVKVIYFKDIFVEVLSKIKTAVSVPHALYEI